MPRWLGAWGLPASERAARAYVVGPALADALRACRRLSRRGLATTICPWNRAVDAPREVADAYCAALDALATENLDCSLSMKAPALAFSRDLLDEVLERSEQAGVGLHFDSLDPGAAEPTFRLIAHATSRAPRVGCTLPARWRRSLRDADMAAEMAWNVRVVKGQWTDADEAGGDLGARFLSVIDRLAGRARHVAVASHDRSLSEEALKRLRSTGTPCELELLFGLPARHSLRVAAAAGVGVRVYAPYGQAWLPYQIAQASRQPCVLWWTLHDLLLGPWAGKAWLRAVERYAPLSEIGAPCAGQLGKSVEP